MMRAFENRADCAVIDEPLYAAYLATTPVDHPAREEVLASQAQDWRVVVEALVSDEPAPVFYQKHMCQHLIDAIDLSFTGSLTNCFLIRDPRRIIASYARVRRQSFTLEELGFPQQLRLFELECERLGTVPPVLDAYTTLKNPAGVLAQLCRRIRIPFDPAMLSWPAGPRASDGVWASHWYRAVWASTGFEAPRPSTTTDTAPLSPELERLCLAAEEIYAAMAPHALQGDTEAEQ